MYHRLIEGLGLIRAQDLAHREDMAKRFLLQLAHRLMRLIDGRRDTRSVAMFGFDRGRETRVVRSQFEPSARRRTAKRCSSSSICAF